MHPDAYKSKMFTTKVVGESIYNGSKYQFFMRQGS